MKKNHLLASAFIGFAATAACFSCGGSKNPVIPPEPKIPISTTTLTVSNIPAEGSIAFNYEGESESLEVDWGDGAVNQETLHTYAEGTEAIIITIKGRISSFSMSDDGTENDNIVKIEIGEGISSIPSYAFKDTDVDNRILIPNSVTSIGSDAVPDCSIYCATSSKPEGWADDWATSVTAHDIVWSVDKIGENDDCNYAITKNGAYIECGKGHYRDEELVIPPTLEDVDVTMIGYNAYERYNNAKSITFPPKLISIGDHAFDECSVLESIDLPLTLISIGREAFASTHGITALVLPSSLVSIGDQAFRYMDKVTEISLPATIEKMGSNVFKECFSLKSICCEVSSKPDNWKKDWVGNDNSNVFWDYGGSEGSDKDYTFAKSSGGAYITGYTGTYSDSLVIPDTLTLGNEELSVISIGNNVFKEQTEIKSVTIPDSVTFIGNKAFQNCKELISVNLLSTSLKELGNNVFNGCDKLETIELPASLETIGNSAFDGCKKLETIELPASLKTIGNLAFSGCDSMNELVIPGGVEYVGEKVAGRSPQIDPIDVFCEATEQPDGWADTWLDTESLAKNRVHWGYKGQGLDEVSKFKYMIMEQGVSILGYTGDETEIEIPTEIKSQPVIGIESGAFYKDEKVNKLSIPNTATFIGERAFEGSHIGTLGIPKSVVNVGKAIIGNIHSPENTLILYIEWKEDELPEGWDPEWNALGSSEVNIDYHWDSPYPDSNLIANLNTPYIRMELI